MRLKQVSVFLENQPGHLIRVCKVLAQANVNLITISIAETKDFGVMRLIVDDPERAKEALSNAKISCKLIDVLSIEVANKAGSFLEILERAQAEKLNIEYAYAMPAQTPESSVMVLKFEDIAAAEKLFK